MLSRSGVRIQAGVCLLGSACVRDVPQIRQRVSENSGGAQRLTHIYRSSHLTAQQACQLPYLGRS